MIQMENQFVIKSYLWLLQTLDSDTKCDSYRLDFAAPKYWDYNSYNIWVSSCFKFTRDLVTTKCFSNYLFGSSLSLEVEYFRLYEVPCVFLIEP